MALEIKNLKRHFSLEGFYYKGQNKFFSLFYKSDPGR
jgi:hypothetical protein